MKEQKILEIFNKTNALLKGHFKLSSGLHSGSYFQCALVLQYPKYAQLLCGELAGQFKVDKPDVVIAPAIGGIFVAHEVARAIGCRSIFTERENNVMTLRRGFTIEKSDRVLVVEDVITTGGSTLEVINVVKQTGATIVGVGAIVNRSCEGIDFGVKFNSLIELNIVTFKPEECPFCKDKVPLVKPGSRRA